jgi:hypothetical protein
MWHAARQAYEKQPELRILGYLVRGTGSSGSGATSSRRGGSGGTRVDPIPTWPRATYASDSLRELEWNRDQVIEGLGENVVEQARLVVEWVLAELRAESGPSRTPKANNVESESTDEAGLGSSQVPIKLQTRHRLVLTALLELKAVDEERRKSADEVAKRAFGLDDASNAKKPLADLKRLRLVDSVEGRGGGSWATPAGVEWARANGVSVE